MSFFHADGGSATRRRRAATAAIAFLAAALAAGAAFADPPPGKGKGHKGNKGGGGSTQVERSSVSVNFNFSDSDRVVIRDYYGGMMARGHCPPGLAKKNNGCMPPGQAKKWAVGHVLPRDVIFYDLPSSLTVRLSAPPAGYRYVRVAKDILLIAAGTGMVAAAIEDLAQM